MRLELEVARRAIIPHSASLTQTQKAGMVEQSVPGLSCALGRLSKAVRESSSHSQLQRSTSVSCREVRLNIPVPGWLGTAHRKCGHGYECTAAGSLLNMAPSTRSILTATTPTWS